MRSSLDFVATIALKCSQHEIDDHISALRDKLKASRSDIDDVVLNQASVLDRHGKIGAGFEATVSGTILLREGSHPSASEVESSGKDALGDSFRLQSTH